MTKRDLKWAIQARKARPTFTQVQRKQSALAADHDGDDAAVRLISKSQVVDRVGVCFPTIWGWIRQRRFPHGRSIGGRTMWIEREVEAWILDQPQRSYKKFKAREVA